MLINLIKIVDNSGMIKHYIDIQVKDLGKQKKQSIFNQWRKQGQGKQNSSTILYWCTKLCMVSKNLMYTTNLLAYFLYIVCAICRTLSMLSSIKNKYLSQIRQYEKVQCYCIIKEKSCHQLTMKKLYGRN